MMKDKCCAPNKIKQLHEMDAFGISKVSLNAIRIDRLSERINPKVPFPHKHAFYQIILFTKGTGIHDVDFDHYKVDKNHIFILKPGQIHDWKLKDADGFVVEFNHDTFSGQSLESSNLIKNIHLAPDSFIQKNKDEYEKLKILCEFMFKESNAQMLLSDISLKSLLTSFVIELIRQAQTINVNHSKTQFIEKFRDLIEQSYKKEHRVEFYAKNLGLTPKNFTMQLSRLIGKSPREMIQSRLLLEAKRYLTYSDLSISEIGYELGFDDANYFSRFFRLHEGKTPASFRNAASGK